MTGDDLSISFDVVSAPPAWAVLQRRLLVELTASTRDFLDRFTREDGEFIWGQSYGASADDFWEPYFNWPLLYSLGGGDDLRAISRHQFDAVRRQLDSLGALHLGYERGSDQFHQSEANTFLANLLAACIDDDELVDYVAGISSLFGPASPVGNVNEAVGIFRSPILGSDGPGTYFGAHPEFGWRKDMRVYGLPLADVPGVLEYDDLKDPALAQLLGKAMQARFSRGDVVSNLLATSLLLMDVLSRTDGARRSEIAMWLRRYVSGWAARLTPEGLIADNVGPTGAVGEDFGGDWYGGLYGWSWPHGYYSVGVAISVGACNALLAGGADSEADFARTVHRAVVGRGEYRDPRREVMTMRHHFPAELSVEAGQLAYLVPYRNRAGKWFDWHPVYLAPLVALWNLTGDPRDWELIKRVLDASTFDRKRYDDFKTKEDAGHEAPWLAFLMGENDGYPETALRHAFGQVALTRQRIRDDVTDLTDIDESDVDVMVHHWQLHNPITTEALVQLTTGAAQPLYNGGSLGGVVRHFDIDSGRQGLATDVAALVTSVSQTLVTIELVNIGTAQSRRCRLQAGWYGQHEFTSVEWTAGASATEFHGVLPGQQAAEYAADPDNVRVAPGHGVTHSLGARGFIDVTLGPSAHIRLVLGLRRFARAASFGSADL